MRISVHCFGLSLGALLSACSPEAIEIFVPAPEALENARSVVYLISGDGKEQIVARAADDPSPLRPTASLSGGRKLTIEALLFDYSLEELGLESGAFAPLAPNAGVPLLSLDPMTLVATVTESDTGSWRMESPSTRATELRVRGPCPRFEVTSLGEHGSARTIIGRDDEILMFEARRLTTLRLSKSGAIQTSSVTIELLFEPRVVTFTGASQGWMTSTGGDAGVFELDPFRYESRFQIPDYPDVLDESGNPRGTVVAALASLETSDHVLAVSSGGVVGTYDPSAGFERLDVAQTRGTQSKQGFVVPDEHGRTLASLSGYQGYFVYASSNLRLVPSLEAGATGVGVIARTAKFGTLLIGRDTGIVLHQSRPDEWEEIPDMRLDFETAEIVDFLDGVIVNGQRGELAFYSERTGLCPTPLTMELRGEGGVSSAALGDVIVRSMRTPDGTGAHKTWLFRATTR